MPTVDITLEDASFAELAAVSRAAGLTPAEFITRTLAAALRRHKARDAAHRDATGYTAAPVSPDEFPLNPNDLPGADDAPW